MDEMVTAEVALRSVVAALERVHVLGGDAEMLGGAIRTVKNVIDAMEEKKKEAARLEAGNEHRQDA